MYIDEYPKTFHRYFRMFMKCSRFSRMLSMYSRTIREYYSMYSKSRRSYIVYSFVVSYSLHIHSCPAYGSNNCETETTLMFVFQYTDCCSGSLFYSSELQLCCLQFFFSFFLLRFTVLYSVIGSYQLHYFNANIY